MHTLRLDSLKLFSREGWQLRQGATWPSGPDV